MAGQCVYSINGNYRGNWFMESGDMIPIEERDPCEVTHMSGLNENGIVGEFQITLSKANNPAFDITPAKLVTGYITERGILNKICDWKDNNPEFMKISA